MRWRRTAIITRVKKSIVLGGIFIVHFIIVTLWVSSTRRATPLVLPTVTALQGWSLHPYRASVRLGTHNPLSHSKLLWKILHPNIFSYRYLETKPSTMQHSCLPTETCSLTTEEEVIIMDILQLSLTKSFEDVSLIQKACQIFQSTKAGSATSATSNLPEHRLVVALAIEVTNQLCQIGSDSSRKRKTSWNDLQLSAQRLLVPTNESDATALAVAVVFGVLALTTDSGAKAAASALATTISSSKWLQESLSSSSSSSSSTVPAVMLRSYFQLAIDGSLPSDQQWNWNILTQFTRAFHLNGQDHPELSSLLTKVVEGELERIHQGIHTVEERKSVVAGILALTCQMKPWSSGLSPVPLVQVAIPLDFWHAAEALCQSAATTSPHVAEAVEYLIDSAMEERTYRRADNLATNLYDIGGRSRYIQARFQHACDTISQVIYKRQLPIIERQVSRVDQAVQRVQQDPPLPSPLGSILVLDDNDSNDDNQTPLEIRRFALTRLEEAGEHDMAHRLATIWEMDYVLDPQALEEAARVRRQTYLQYDEVLSCPIPDLISDAERLRQEFGPFWKQGPYPHGPIGMDAEWEEGTEGVDVLQLSHPQQALLLDMPALVSTAEGRRALHETVGQLLHSVDTTVVGFACRQDLSRLRRHDANDWLVGTRAVVDIQPMVLAKEPSLAAATVSRVGLARMCQYFLGKPLDKSEQCSYWGARPLSVGQRSYAALDAWVCAAVYQQLYPPNEDGKEGVDP